MGRPGAHPVASPPLKMNVLYIAPCIPYPPNKGEKIRAFYQIRLLSREHTIHLACLANEKNEVENLEKLQKHCASIDAVYRDKTVARLLAVLAFLAGKPFSVASYYSSRLKRMIAQKLSSEKFDRILVFSSAMADYVRNVSSIPKILDFVDLDSETWRLYVDHHSFPFSWTYRLEAGRLARYEEKISKEFDHSIFVTEKEASLFRQRVNNRRVSVIPNGVDLDYFAPTPDLPSGAPVIVFVGTMDYFPNIDAVRYFCRHIFPSIKKVLPAVHFYIVGRNPTGPVKKLGREPQVTVTGSVPDVRPYLAQAGVAVAPFRIARGIQNKNLEAMAMGVPVVGTSTAFEGMAATGLDGVRITDGPEQFAQEVLALLNDPEWRRQCSLRARRYVQRYHKWEDQVARLACLLRTIAEPPVSSDQRYDQNGTR
jgi:sugar transferase (PEP-CTERM/EpsH1 system associated)